MNSASTPLNSGPASASAKRRWGVIRTILVPVETQERSRPLLEFSDILAGQLQANLVLLHIFKPFDYAPPHSTARQYDRVNAIIETNAQVSLADFFQHMTGLPKVQAAKTMVIGGSIEIAVVHVARDIQADLILLGTHAYTGVKRFLLGSKAEDIIRRAHCPVLVVPPPATQRP